MKPAIKKHLFRLIPVLLTLSLARTLPANAALDSLPEEHPLYRRVQAIYERLTPAFGNERMAPRLLVVPKGTKSREPVASSAGGNEGTLAFEAGSGLLSEGYVAIEERTVEVLSGLGADSDNALAFLLAHELAHVYLRHGWVGDFGNAFARTDMGRKMMKAATYDDLVRREAEADHFGGFYGYLAGYDTLGAAPKVLDRIYASFGLADQLPNYPSKTERIAIARRQLDSITKLIPVYEAATRLLILGRHEDSGRLFSHLARIFPSREMFNNAGVAFALEALHLLPQRQLFVYPFELDAESRLNSREQGGQRIARAGRTDDPRAVRLLRRSLNAFEQAGRRDAHYAAARVNSASAHCLLGEYDEAIRLAGAALALARQEGERVSAAHALVARGIALARSGELQRARSELEAARPVAPELSILNLAALEGVEPPMGRPAREAGRGPVETIAGFTAQAVEREDSAGHEQTAFTLDPAETSELPLTIRSRQGRNWNSATIIRGKRNITILSTTRFYRGSSARGIRIGSPLAAIGQSYGSASTVIPSRQGVWYVFNGPGIVFETDAMGKVAGWFVFSAH